MNAPDSNHDADGLLYGGSHEHIRALRQMARQWQDHALVEKCDDALGGDERALLDCEDWIEQEGIAEPQQWQLDAMERDIAAARAEAEARKTPAELEFEAASMRFARTIAKLVRESDDT